MRTLRTNGDRRGHLAAAAAAVLMLVGVLLTVRGLNADAAPPQPSAVEARETRSAQTPSVESTTAGRVGGASAPSRTEAPSAPGTGFGSLMPPSPPVSLKVPSIGVDTKGIVDLALDSNGRLEAPTDFDRAGWWAAGPTPGEFGPAVIGAHVDSKAGPAVFYRLGALKRGATVSVGRKDGSTARFVVDRVARYSKADFPTSVVYADTKGRAELRLITCGGAFDHASGHYVDNLVAFAHLVP
jgi:hypothetical protein